MTPSGWAVGWMGFAAVLMIMLGGWWMFAGFVGIVDDQFYVKGAEYLLQFDTTTWGWIHLLMGLIVLLAGSVSSGERSGLARSASSSRY